MIFQLFLSFLELGSVCFEGLKVAIFVYLNETVENHVLQPMIKINFSSLFYKIKVKLTLIIE